MELTSPEKRFSLRGRVLELFSLGWFLHFIVLLIPLVLSLPITVASAPISDPSFNFTLDVTTPTTQTVLPGFSTNYTVEATLIPGGTSPTTTSVDLTLSGCPMGASCVLSRKNITPQASTSSNNTSKLGVGSGSTAPGSYPITITATGGGITRTTSVILVVKNFDFALAVTTPTTQTVLPGFSTNYTVEATLIPGGTSPTTTSVDLTLSGCPMGASCVLSRKNITPQASTSSNNTSKLGVGSGSTAPGSYPITITATGGGITRTAFVILIVKNLVSPQPPATIPSVPSLIAPGATSVPGPELTDTTPTLSWRSASGATWYDFEVRDTITNTLVENRSNQISTSFTTLILPRGNYRWNVRACSSVGCSGYSARYYFRIKSATGSKPDLIPRSIVLSSTSVVAGDPLSVVWMIANQGSGSAGSSTTGLRLTTSPTVTSPNDISLGNVSTPSIGGSSLISQSKTITIPSGTATGTYYVWVVADNTFNSTLNQSNIANDYARSAAVNVISSCAPPTSTPIPLVLGVETTSTCIAIGKKQIYSFNVQAALNYSVILTPESGNPDLYLAPLESCINLSPSSQSCYLSQPLKYPGTSTETLSVTASSTGTYYVAVYGIANSAYKLRIAAEPLAKLTGDNAAQTGDQVNFSGESSIGSSSTCDIADYTWDFGDGTGTISSGTDPTNAYTYNSTNGGSPFLVTLTVTDCTGQTDDVTMNVNVTGQANGLETDSSYSDDPVNLATGNYTDEQTDLSIPGPGISFVFTRSYNSKDASLRQSSLGFGWRHSYDIRLDSASTVIEIRFGNGNKESYSDNGDGTYSTNPGNYNTLINNGDGTFTLTTKQLHQYLFDVQGRLSRIVDKNGNTLALTYDAGNLDTITDTAERLIDFTYDASNRLTQITDPAARTVTFVYDGNGDLIKVIDPNGGETQNGYNVDHQIERVIDPRLNILVRNTYDDQRRVVESQKDALENQTTFVYDFETQVTTVTDALGNQSYHQHDDQLRILSITDSLGNVQGFAYDANNNRTEVTDKNGYTTRYEYDPLGNVTKKVDPLGNETTIEYDANNNPTKRIDARGNTATNFYDTEGNLIKVEDALKNATRFTYDAVGRRLTQVDALTRTTTTTYDKNSNLLNIKDPADKTVVYTYDKNDNRESVTDKRSNATRFTYDEKDRLTLASDPLSSTVSTAYDALDRKKTVTDKNDNVTQYEYDEVGNLSKVTNALGESVQYRYDAEGNQRSATSPLGQTTSYTYDPLNRIRTETTPEPLNNTTNTAYDVLGRVISLSNALSQTSTFTYNALGQRTWATHSGNGCQRRHRAIRLQREWQPDLHDRSQRKYHPL